MQPVTVWRLVGDVALKPTDDDFEAVALAGLGESLAGGFLADLGWVALPEVVLELVGEAVRAVHRRSRCEEDSERSEEFSFFYSRCRCGCGGCCHCVRLARTIFLLPSCFSVSALPTAV